MNLTQPKAEVGRLKDAQCKGKTEWPGVLQARATACCRQYSVILA